MFNIADYLSKFKNIGQGEKALKQNIVSSILEITGINLSIDKIEVKNGEATLKVSPGIRTAVFIKREQILSKIKEKGGGVVSNLH